MKNFELKFWLSCMMMALCLGFTSCGDDDEGIEGDANELIIGDWKVVDEYGWYKYQDEETGKWVKEEYGKEDGDYINEIFSFKKDGTGSEKQAGYTENFTWKINAQKLTLKYDHYSMECTIEQMNAKKATMSFYEKDEDGEEEANVLVLEKQ